MNPDRKSKEPTSDFFRVLLSTKSAEFSGVEHGADHTLLMRISYIFTVK